jgi:hypothetical protein
MVSHVAHVAVGGHSGVCIELKTTMAVWGKVVLEKSKINYPMTQKFH